MAGELMMRAAREHGAEIVPVDSEHCAIHQALRCGLPQEVVAARADRLGRPLPGARRSRRFPTITVEDALAHPTWKMGPKITIDSATMMNKGLEIIEAQFLFELPADRIDVVIHPQSVVHSFVEYVDGSLIAQLSKNDMKFPILYALTYPERIRIAFRSARPLDARAPRLPGPRRPPRYPGGRTSRARRSRPEAACRPC